MPLKFTNLNKPKMKNYKELTKEEFDLLKKWHGQMAYSNDELAGMVNMNRLYVNEHTASCLSCQGKMRTTKGELMSFYLEHKEEWEQMFKTPVAPIELEKIKTKKK